MAKRPKPSLDLNCRLSYHKENTNINQNQVRGKTDNTAQHFSSGAVYVGMATTLAAESQTARDILAEIDDDFKRPH